MIEGKRILFIGAGNMAEALIEGLIKSGKVSHKNIAIIEVRAQQRTYIQRKFGLQTYSSIRDGSLSSDVIVFAVKPQNIQDVLTEFQGVQCNTKIFISIVAGVSISCFEKVLGEGVSVVRVMPNMAALIGQGIAGVSRGHFVADEDEKVALEIMSTVGEVVLLPESQLDAVTAMSGSGPAYFFYFMEALQRAGVQLGLDPVLSSKLVNQTALGAALLIQKTKETPEALRKKVTSPGGTTEAAIREFETSGIVDAVVRAVKAAEKRSKELSKG